MDTPNSELALLRLLAARLERLSADSRWAHRASGIRGQVLRTIEEMERDGNTARDVQVLIEAAFAVLTRAGMEILPPQSSGRPHRFEG